MKYYGIDVTQHQEYCASASCENNILAVKQERRVSHLPTAILPEYKHEKILLSSDVEKSRRGLGLMWPRTAQIPVGGNVRNGVGRIPLLTCLSNIKAAGDADEWKYINSDVQWTPHINQPPLVFSNAELLGQVFKRLDDIDNSCFVIPEGFAESAQQTLLEVFPENTHLIPRSIALALKWCKEQEERYQNLHISGTSTQTVGHLICAALGFGEWEVSLIEIQAQMVQDRIHLIPIYDPAQQGQGLKFCGFSLCSKLHVQSVNSNTSNELATWLNLCNSTWFNSILKGQVRLSLATMHAIGQALVNPSTVKVPFPDLAIMRGLTAQQEATGNLQSRLSLSLSRQRERIPGNIKFLGIAAGGSFAEIPVKLYSDSPQTIAHWLFASYTKHIDLTLYSPSVFAEGAALAACNIAQNQPSYRIKLLPLFLYTVGRNDVGDKVEKWEELIPEGKTIAAGETYKQPKPIKGLSIPEGKEHLELTLRRPGKQRQEMYRSVVAKIPQKTERKEAVYIQADVRPGQGFARVHIDSQRRGVFSAMLDWRTMKNVSKPELKLEYIPDVAFITQDDTLWDNARHVLQYFIDSHQPGNINYYLDDAREVLNKWYIDRESNNIFRHLGPISNTGQHSSNIYRRKLLENFIAVLEESWKAQKSLNERERLLRLGGWLYLFIPDSMKQNVIKAIANGSDKMVHLHVAGLTFYKDAEFRVFYTAFCKQVGVYRNDPSAEWFRALRNLVRFRDNALSKEVMSDSQAEEILGFIRDGLINCSQNYKVKTYNNCIESLIYMLKRRRYDENFLPPGDPMTLELQEALKQIRATHSVAKYRNIAGATLAFLNREATIANTIAILEAEE